MERRAYLEWRGRVDVGDEGAKGGEAQDHRRVVAGPEWVGRLAIAMSVLCRHGNLVGLFGCGMTTQRDNPAAPA